MMNKLGFGFLRLPGQGQLQLDTINTLVDAYMAGGGTFFDTAYTYLDGKSELAIRECVVRRKPRGSFQICDKLPGYRFTSPQDCQTHLEEMLRRCGVDYFDILMLHWLNARHYAIAEKTGQFAFLREKKAQGLARRIGFSFHGSAQLLDQILTEHPEVDVVLIQLNYLDWDSAGIQSRQCYKTCLRHGKSVMVMEPVKGGTLADLPEAAESLLRHAHPDWSSADWALRFVQSLPGVEICLSGMNTLRQVQDNIRPFAPLTPEENALLMQVRDIIEAKTAIACTNCQYCLPHCPNGLPIPHYLRLYNEWHRCPQDDWKLIPAYHQLTQSFTPASQCLSCQACQSHCPQNLPIADAMSRIAAIFESNT